MIEFAAEYRETLAKEDGDKIRTWQMDASKKIYESVCRLADKDKLSENFMKEFISIMNKIKGIEKLEGPIDDRNVTRLTEKMTRRVTNISPKEMPLLPNAIPISTPQKPKPLWEESDFETAEETVERQVEFNNDGTEIVEDEDSDGD